MVGTLGARVGNHTSYQSSFENRALGTPRGGRRTVPMRAPSPFRRRVPRRTMRMLMARYPRVAWARYKDDGGQTTGPHRTQPDSTSEAVRETGALCAVHRVD